MRDICIHSLYCPKMFTELCAKIRLKRGNLRYGEKVQGVKKARFNPGSEGLN